MIVGRSWEAGGARAYWPWVEAFRAHVERGEPERFARRPAQAEPSLPSSSRSSASCSGAVRAPAIESESARLRLFEAVALFLKRAAALRPLALILDDLHAADEQSLLWLQSWRGRRLRPPPDHRCVPRCRPDDLGAADSTLVETAGEPTTRTIALAGLDEAYVAGSSSFRRTCREQSTWRLLFIRRPRESRCS